MYREPPAWAAAAHAIIVDDTVHYLWGEKRQDNTWVHMHSSAPTSDPTAITDDIRNPTLLPSAYGFDDQDVEYPFPFWNPADQRYYVYYLGQQGNSKPRLKQTGLLVGDGDFGQWQRVGTEPVVTVGGRHEQHGASHPSVAIADDMIHMVYTGESPAPAERRQILYNVPSIGHVRTRDFRTFEPNPHNPIFTPSTDPDAWDCDGLLTPQVFAMNGTYYMIYAGLKGSGWNRVSAVQTGLAVAWV